LIEEIKPPILYKVNDLKAYAESNTRKKMSYLEDGRHPMNGEIEDEAESMS
jgi:hypothetical protein